MSIYHEYGPPEYEGPSDCDCPECSSSRLGWTRARVYVSLAAIIIIVLVATWLSNVKLGS